MPDKPAVPMELRPIRRAAVLGAGVMGAQIAAHLANAGLEVDLLDIAPKEGKKNAIVEGAFKKLGKIKPPAFMSDHAKERIRLGNFEDNLARVGEADWVVEVVLERMEVKRALWAKIENLVAPDAVLSTNTSGLSIAGIVEGLRDDVQRRFLGTHFFNPPRYLPLFEVIPTPKTEGAVLARIAEFARVRLGKGVVSAKDTPNFIGNRVGVYAMMIALGELESGELGVTEIDALTGPLVGRPKSATFRTADVVGLDTLVHVAENLFEAIPNDESRDVFRVPAVVKKLVEAGATGQKAGAGFYKKAGKEILALDPAKGEHVSRGKAEVPGLEAIKKAGPLPARLRAAMADEGPAGRFFRRTVLPTLAYAARRIPEIAESPADVDRAIRWGFGWQLGPFETWDALGFEATRDLMAREGLALPEWIKEVEGGFYRGPAAAREVLVPGQGYHPLDTPADEVTVAGLLAREGAELAAGPEWGLVDMGEGVGLYEFRSKANTLGSQVMAGLLEAIERLERGELRALVVGNDGENFSVGANLAEFAGLAKEGRLADIGKAVERFQEVVTRLRYASRPVVVATQGKVLGGGCELALACPNTVAAAESYMGLVELGVGLIPAGTGTTRMAAMAAKRARKEDMARVHDPLAAAFRVIGMAHVAMSGYEAREIGLLAETAEVVMRRERRLAVARARALYLAESGYAPPPRDEVFVLGRQGRATIESFVHNLMRGNFASEYDRHLASRLAWVMTGGDLSAPQRVPEDYLLELERKVFLELLGEKKTHERIEAILTTNKPLRN